MTLTYELIKSFGIAQDSVSLNSYQLRVLGVGSPPKHGWVGELIGKEISQADYELLKRLRGIKLRKERKQIMNEFGINAQKLFQQKLF